MSDTTNSIKRRFLKEIEIETDPYKRRLNQVQDVCRQHGLATESDIESHREEGIDYRRIHTEYTSKVPDKVTPIEFIIGLFSFRIFVVLHNASQEIFSCVLLDP